MAVCYFLYAFLLLTSLSLALNYCCFYAFTTTSQTSPTAVDDTTIVCDTEADIFRALGRDFVDPQDREA